MRTRFPIPVKPLARVPILDFFNTPSAKTTKIQIPEKDVSKVPYFVEEIGPDGQNMRRTLGESAFFVMGKNRVKVQIPIFATPLVRERQF